MKNKNNIKRNSLTTKMKEKMGDSAFDIKIKKAERKILKSAEPIYYPKDFAESLYNYAVLESPNKELKLKAEQILNYSSERYNIIQHYKGDLVANKDDGVEPISRLMQLGRPAEDELALLKRQTEEAWTGIHNKYHSTEKQK